MMLHPRNRLEHWGLQCVAVCCSVLQCVAGRFRGCGIISGLCHRADDDVHCSVLQLYCSVLQCIAVCSIPEIHQIEQLKFLGTHSNWTEISDRLCSAVGWLQVVGSLKS